MQHIQHNQEQMIFSAQASAPVKHCPAQKTPLVHMFFSLEGSLGIFYQGLNVELFNKEFCMCPNILFKSS